MRGLAFVMLLIGCGRLGFDDVTPAPDPIPDICDPAVAGDLAINGETPTKLRAAALSDGYAVAVETSATNVYVVRTDLAGIVLSTQLPMMDGYLLHGISQIGDRPFVYVFVGGTGYIKMLVPDWSSYETGPSGDALPLDPQQALLAGGGTALYGVFTAGTLAIHAIDGTGATMIDADYAPVASSASFTSIPSGVRVVVEDAGTCETFVVKADGTTKDVHTFAPCVEPLIAAIDDARVFVLHRTSAGGPYAIHTVPTDAGAAGSTTTIESGSNGRITAIDDAIWIAYLRPTGEARLVRVDDNVPSTRDYAAIAAGFDLLADRAFWVDVDGKLATGTPCTP